MFWLAEDDCGAAQSAASRSLQSGLDLYLRLRGLQLGAHAKSGGHSSGGVGRGRRVSAWAGFSPIGPRNIKNQLLATTRDEKQQAKHRIPQFFSSLLGRRFAAGVLACSTFLLSSGLRHRLARPRALLVRCLLLALSFFAPDPAPHYHPKMRKPASGACSGRS